MGMLDWLFGKPAEYTPDMADAADSAAAAVAAPGGEDQQALKLRVGDVVAYDGVDFIIEQKYIYSSGGYYWYSYHLKDRVGDKEQWISAEYDDELIITLDEDLDMTVPKQAPSTLTYRNRGYRQCEHGHAQVTIWHAGSAKPVTTTVEYWDYEGEDDDTTLGVERWDDETKVAISKQVEPYELTIYPRSVPAGNG